MKKAKVQTLRTEFESLSMKDSEQLDDFYLKLNGLVSNIRALGESLDESYVVKKLLRVVPSKFLQIVSTMEQFGDLETMTLEEAVGSLKAHEERLKGNSKSDSNEGQLMLTEEEWQKREGGEGKLLLTREDWLRRSNRRNSDGTPANWKGRGRDRSNLKCYNCSAYGHFAVECRKPRRTREQKEEVNMTKLEDDEPALLLVKCNKETQDVAYLSEKQLVPSQMPKVQSDSNIWYLDNGASSHMTGFKLKFLELNEEISGEVSFGDGSTVSIKGVKHNVT